MLFAHADHFHTESTNSFEHFLTGEWFLASVVVIALVGWWIYAKRWRLGGLLGILLLSGLLTYQYAPLVAAFSLTSGFALALLTTLSMLKSNQSDGPTAKSTEAKRQAKP